jgi:hypothetical protein
VVLAIVAVNQSITERPPLQDNNNLKMNNFRAGWGFERLPRRGGGVLDVG